jgi:hypothetical protein
MSKDRAYEWHCWKEDVDKYRLIPPPRYSLQRRGFIFSIKSRGRHNEAADEREHAQAV